MNLEADRLTKKASQLRIAAFSLAENMRTGNFKSIHRGQGIEFSDVRDYFPGDAVRAIDWNVTARMGRPFIKQYEEDRELSVILILDCSASMEAGSGAKTRLGAATEAAALLLLASEQNSGATGAVFFDGEIRFACPPKTGKKNAMMIFSKLDTVAYSEPGKKSTGSVLPNALKCAAKLLKRRALIFVISDFRCAHWETPLADLAQKNDIVAVKITDPSDSALPEIGTIPVFDRETERTALFPTAARKFKSLWSEANRQRTDAWKSFCLKHGAHPLALSTEEDCALVLSRFFAQKSRTQR